MATLLFSLAVLFAVGDVPSTIEIAGRVIDAQGRPVAKAAVELLVLPSAAESRKLELLGKAAPDPIAQTATDSDGRFALTAPNAGMYEVVVRAPGAVPFGAALFPLLSAAALPPLRLEKSETLRIRINGSDGRPRADARVAAWPNRSQESNDGWAPWRRFGLTDATGILDLPRRHGESVDLAAAGRELPEVRASRVTAATADLRSEALCTRQLLIRDANGSPVADAFVSTDLFTLAATDAAGAATVAAPCAHEMSLIAQTADGRSARARLQPPAPGQPAPPLELPLEGPERYAGRVLDAETRAPLAGALVWSDDDPAGFVRTDTKGGYVLVRPRAGQAGARLVRAAAPGHLPGSERAAAGRLAVPTFALQPTAVLAGVVVDTSGKGVPSAEIKPEEFRAEAFPHFGARPAGLPRSAISRANGAFRIEVLPRRAYILHASCTGFAPASLTVAEKLTPSATRSGLRLVLTAGTGAFGKVLDATTSRPIAGTEVHLVPATSQAALPSYLRKGDDSPEQEYQAWSDAEGTFRFEHLPNGRFDLTAKADGFAPRTNRGVTIEPTGSASGAGPTDLGLLRLERGLPLEGTVVDRDDQPIAGAAVTAVPPSAIGIHADAPAGAPEAITGRDGRFTLPGLTQGETVDVNARRQGYVPNSVSRVELPAREPVRIVLERAARVSGRVISDAGDPVAAALVTARPADAALPAGLSGPVTNTDMDGTFVFDDLAAGRVSLGAAAKGFVSMEPRLLDVGNGASVDGVELTLRRGATIEGLVLTPSGAPATAARVALRQTVTPDRMLQIEVAGSVPTDGDGHYRLEGVPVGAQTVSADQEGYVRAVGALDVRPGENRLDLRLREGYSVTGHVVDGGGRPLAGVAIGLFSSIPGVVKEDTSDAGGAFRFAGLDTGRYNLSAQKESYSSAQQEVEIADHAVDGIELKLQQGGGVIVGRILGLQPDAIPQVGISAVKRPLDSLDALREGHADYAGNYRIEGVFPGDWTVTAALPNGRQVRRSVTMAEGSPQVPLDLEFGQGITLTGTVRRGGQPVADASVQATGLSSDSFGSAVTDGGGAFRIEGLMAGDHKVVALVAQSGLRAERLVTLSGNQNIDIVLPTARASGVAIESASGSPLAGVTVAAEAVSGATGSPPPRATTDTSGSFALANLGKGSYRIYGDKDGYARAEVSVEVPADDAVLDNLRLTLDREQGLILDVSSAAGTPPRIGVALLDATGQPLFSQTVSTGENGRTTIPNAPNGSFRLIAGADGMATASLQVAIPGPPVPVLLARAARVNVDVPELAGKGAVGTLTVAGSDGQPFRSVSAGTLQLAWPLINGRTIVDGLPAGRWTLFATGPNNRKWTGSVTTVEGQQTQASLR